MGWGGNGGSFEGGVGKRQIEPFYRLLKIKLDTAQLTARRVPMLKIVQDKTKAVREINLLGQ